MPLTRADKKPASFVGEGDQLPPEDRAGREPPPSLEQVYRAHRPRWLQFISRRSSPEVADDILQQSILRVLAKPALRVPGIWRLDNYLFRVARSVMIDEARAERSRLRDEHVLLEELEEVSPADIPAADQIAALEARDMLNRLEAVMQRLTPRTREIFLAHRIDGYTYGEIAARTGLSVKGVEKHMTRAIAAIDRNTRPR